MFREKIMCMRYFTFPVAKAKFTRQYKAQKWNKSFAHIEHRAGVVCQEVAKRGWWTKFQTSLLNIYFNLSGFQSSLLFNYFRYGSHLYGTVHICSHCTDQSETTNLSDKWRSVFEIGAAQLRSVTEITPKSPFLCMERSPTRCCFHTGAKATCYSVTSWRQWYG